MQESKLLAREVNHHNDLERCSDDTEHPPPLELEQVVSV